MNKETLAVWGGLLVLIAGIGTAVYFGAIKTTVQDNKTSATETTGGSEQNTINNNPTESTMDNTKATQATIKTNYGSIVVEFDNKAPNTVANFAKLASEKFYDGIKFHRVIKGFMIQAGDPFSKDDSLKSQWGTGGPGYKFNDELTGQEKYPTGTLAMANAGPNTNGSQFFINTANNNFLDTKHTVFGKVVAGMDVVSKIENNKTGQNDRPIEDMIIEKMEVK